MKTNLEKITTTSKVLFDAVPIKEIESIKGSGIVQHPFFTSIYNFRPDTKELVDLRNPEHASYFRESMFEKRKTSYVVCFSKFSLEDDLVQIC